MDTTDASQWKHVRGINNPADIGTRAVKFEEFMRSEWLDGWAWLKLPKSERPEQVNLIFASDGENIPSSVFMIQAEERKAVIKWKQFSIFRELVNTVTCVQRALSKYKPATLVVDFYEKQTAEVIIFKLLQIGEEMKSLKAEKEIPKCSQIIKLSHFIDEEQFV